MIEHKATVVLVSEQEVWVEIIQQSACASCRAKTLCSLSEQKEKRLALPRQAGQNWSVGEEVTVCLSTSLGLKAVFLMYVLPLIVLLAVLFSLSALGVSEWITGLAAFAAPLLCYGMVWLFRDRIGQKCVLVLQES